MLIKTAELTGHALSHAVATIEGFKVNPWHEHLRVWLKDHDYFRDQQLAGEIIDRECISTAFNGEGWVAMAYGDPKYVAYGKTRIIAAMRSHVLHLRGDEVEVPDDVLAMKLK